MIMCDFLISPASIYMYTYIQDKIGIKEEATHHSIYRYHRGAENHAGLKYRSAIIAERVPTISKSTNVRPHRNFGKVLNEKDTRALFMLYLGRRICNTFVLRRYLNSLFYWLSIFIFPFSPIFIFIPLIPGPQRIVFAFPLVSLAHPLRRIRPRFSSSDVFRVL